MKRIEEKDFVKKINDLGIEVDPGYPESANLSFRNTDFSRFWTIPSEARKIPYFALNMVYLIGDWESMFVWKHMGSWNTRIEGERINDDMQAIIYRGIGISGDNADILEFNRSEIEGLTALIMNQLLFGWSIGDDIYFVPNIGTCFLKTSHHDVIHAEFNDEDKMNQFIKEMKNSGFELPDEPPDETFKKPEWMED